MIVPVKSVKTHKNFGLRIISKTKKETKFFFNKF